MAFTLTYSDGQENEYDDDTAWEFDHGVLKMGRREGEWSVYVSPSHWAVLEVGRRQKEESKDEKSTDDDSTKEKAEEKADDESKEESADKSDGDD